MRPGRLNRILYIGPPDQKGREEILRIRTLKMSVNLVWTYLNFPASYVIHIDELRLATTPCLSISAPGMFWCGSHSAVPRGRHADYQTRRQCIIGTFPSIETTWVASDDID